jgi:hypothetical protein
MILFLFFWLGFSIAVALLASRYNRSGFGWFLLSLLLSPLLALVFVLACGPRAPGVTVTELEPVPTSEEVGAAYRDARAALERRSSLPPHVQRMLDRSSTGGRA